jgi:Domain of unknown function (DUF4386)
MVAYRRVVAGTSLLAAPACGLAWSLMQAPFTGYPAEVAFIAEHPNRWIASTLLGIFMSYLFIPAILGVMHLLAVRHPRLAHVGGSLACMGAASHGSVLGFQLCEAPLVASGLPLDQLAAILPRLYEHRAFMAIVMPVLALYAGLFVLSVGLWLSRVAPRWVPLVIVGAIGIELFTPLTYKARVMFALFLLAFGWLGIRVLRMGDATWARPADGRQGPFAHGLADPPPHTAS